MMQSTKTSLPVLPAIPRSRASRRRSRRRCRRGVQRFRETLTTIFSFDLDPPGASTSRALVAGCSRRQRQAQASPATLARHTGLGRRRRGPPSAALSSLWVLPRRRIGLLIFADTGEGAAFQRSGNHVAVQHKAQAAEGGRERQAGIIHLAKRGGVSRLLIDRSAARNSVSHGADPQVGGITA
jgi:hypothetical protein